jgi:hypothetical protein
MPAPSISFRAQDESALAAVYDYGTINTGSSGSNVVWMIWNNWSGSGTPAAVNIASAVCSGAANDLGIGAHDSGSANHIDQSTLPTGSLWVSGSYYVLGSGSQGGAGTRVTGSGASDGKTGPWAYVYSGSSGVRKLLITANADGKLSGSADLGGASGSAWVITHYCYVPTGVSQGSKTGSWCLKYTYT